MSAKTFKMILYQICMDEIDDKILEKLNENARMSYREIARELTYH